MWEMNFYLSTPLFKKRLVKERNHERECCMGTIWGELIRLIKGGNGKNTLKS